MNASTDFQRSVVRQHQDDLACEAWSERAAHPHDLSIPARPGGVRVRVGRSLIALGQALAGDSHVHRTA
jgi:hypothetical protein